MGKLPKREAGLSVVELLLIVVIVAIIGVAGWYTYKHHHNTTAASVTTTKPATSQSTTNYFTIKEWGVRAPYSGTDTLTYSIAADNPNLAWVSSQRLADADQNCEIVPNSGNAGSVGRYLPSDNVALESQPVLTAQAYVSRDYKASNSQPPAYAKVGKYYYIYWTGQLGCDTTASSNALYNQTIRAFYNLVTRFQAVTY